MGERQGWLLEPTFQRAVKVVAGNDRLTSDRGVILLRKANHRLRLVESLAARLADPRRQDRIRYALLELLGFRLYALGLGYSAQDDLDRLCHDPAWKLAVCSLLQRADGRGAAEQPADPVAADRHPGG